MLFPSVDWFEALNAEVRREAERFVRIGDCDVKVGVSVTGGARPRRFVLGFEGGVCASVEEHGDAADFTLSAPLPVWREMLENIAREGGADLRHTLNYLQFPGTLSLEGKGQLEHDLFYRFNQTLQGYFDLSHKLRTEFE